MQFYSNLDSLNGGINLPLQKNEINRLEIACAIAVPIVWKISGKFLNSGKIQIPLNSAIYSMVAPVYILNFYHVDYVCKALTSLVVEHSGKH